ncbi:MAG: RdgB/HAM1 family non-canonical purine NTP pyrophosphatase [Candidatus Hydrogenedentes bacterium]|nr:RdgB/HAM1 family non-canonical purine NTP pyrophosphatase [Candidatus Hydrogenedentota bacterium]
MRDALLLATGNRHKVAEIQQILQGLSLAIACLADFPPIDAPVEDGHTFEENARKKAVYYSRHLRARCIAEDSGLVVDALNGAPGVFSARYAGPGATDDKNNAKLLDALAGVPKSQRTARYVCCAVLAGPAGILHTETGTVEGCIALAPRGTNGFGYDPLFIPEGHTRTFGELDPAVKQAISHRADAFHKFRAYLESVP